jgi:hypothetical protein
MGWWFIWIIVYYTEKNPEQNKKHSYNM